jgi:RES domain-containing protein
MRYAHPLLEFELPAELVADLPDPPENWLEAREITRQTGSSWLQAKASLALRVPSAIIPAEPNYLLNPLHPQMPRLKPLRQLEFIWDDRLF